MNKETSMQKVLHTLRVLEIGGLGPGPFCAMHLADLGGRRDQPGAPRQRRPAHHGRFAQPGQALGLCRPRIPRGPRPGAAAGGPGRHPHRRHAPRQHGAPGPGPARVPRRQSRPGLWPHDRLGPARPAGDTPRGTMPTTPPCPGPCGAAARPMPAPSPPWACWGTLAAGRSI